MGRINLTMRDVDKPGVPESEKISDRPERGERRDRGDRRDRNDRRDRGDRPRRNDRESFDNGDEA